MRYPTNRAAEHARDALADIPRQIAALRAMSGKELKERYREIYGEPSRSNNVGYLRKKIGWKIQELAEGGLSERALARIHEIGKGAPIRLRPAPAVRAAVAAILEAPAEVPSETKPRDLRLPPAGTVLRREYQGTVHEVLVLTHGFDFKGEHYKSLSRLARAITGTPWNGWLFFGLAKRKEAR